MPKYKFKPEFLFVSFASCMGLFALISFAVAAVLLFIHIYNAL